jgi:uncharacterized protein YPO0396
LFYKKLIEEDLVRFEKKFNDYLRETITNKVSAFRMFFENWADSINDNIHHLNKSLEGIDFNNNSVTGNQENATANKQKHTIDSKN